MYLKNRIIFFFLFLYFVLSFIFFLPFSSYQSISFCFRWFRIAFVGFVSFRFHFVDFVSFRFAFVDFVSFRFYFVSHFIGTPYCGPKVQNLTQTQRSEEQRLNSRNFIIHKYWHTHQTQIKIWHLNFWKFVVGKQTRLGLSCE